MANSTDKPTASVPKGAPVIHIEDAPVEISRYPEDWIALAIFWVLALVVFAQFFTRYVLNDSLSWTEEIARYLLMVLTFVGAGIVTRKRLHIAVEMLETLLPDTGGRVLRAVVDVITLGFVALLAWFSVTMIERMHIQRMTMIEAPMSIVYGAIAVGILIMLLRNIIVVVENARTGWRKRDDGPLITD